MTQSPPATAGVGLWAVINSSYGFGGVPRADTYRPPQQVTKITEARVYFGDRFKDKSGILGYAPTEAAAKLIAERITSSAALYDEECRKSRARHEERVRQITLPTGGDQ